MRGLLKASAIINFVTVAVNLLLLLVLSPIFLWMGTNFTVLGMVYLLATAFILITGLLFLNYSKLELFELYEKKDIILLLGIIFLFVNFIVSILLFVAYDQIKIKGRGTKKELGSLAVKAKQIDPEIKKVDSLLKMGVALVGLSGLIFATTSWEIVSAPMKIIILLIMSILFIWLAIFSEKKLKLEQSTKMYWILGICFIIFTGIACGCFKIFGDYYSFTGRGMLVFMATLTALATTLLGITAKKFNNKVCLYSSFVGAIITLCLILAHASVSFVTIVLILMLLVSLVNISVKNENNIVKRVDNFNLTITIVLSMIIMIYFLFSNQQSILLNSVTSILIGCNLLCFVCRKKHDFVNMVVPVILIMLLATMVISFNISLANSLCLAGILYLISYIAIIFAIPLHNNKTFEFGLILMIDIALLFIFALSFFVNPNMVMFTGILILITTLINCLFTKDYSKLEYYLNPFKILLVTIATLYLFNTILPISFLFGICICYLVLLLGYLLTSEKKIKLEYFLLFGLLLIIALYNVNEGSERIPSLIVLLSSFLPFIITDKSKDSIYKNLSLGSFILMLIAIYHIIVNSSILGVVQNIDVFLVMFIYLIILLFERTNKEYFMATSIAVIIPFYGLTNGVLCSYETSIIVTRLLAFYILYLMVNNLVKNKNTQSTLYAIFSCLILFTVVFEQSLTIGLFVSLICLMLMIIGIIKDEYKALFVTGLVFLILNLIFGLRNFWFQVPFWLYLLIAGSMLIGIVMYKEINKKK